jgi:hypothetical protein
MCWTLCSSGALAARGSLEMRDPCLWLVMLPAAHIKCRQDQK